MIKYREITDILLVIDISKKNGIYSADAIRR